MDTESGTTNSLAKSQDPEIQANMQRGNWVLGGRWTDKPGMGGNVYPLSVDHSQQVLFPDEELVGYPVVIVEF